MAKRLTEGREITKHTGEIPRLKRIIGHLEGVERMIRESRQSPEIL